MDAVKTHDCGQSRHWFPASRLVEEWWKSRHVGGSEWRARVGVGCAGAYFYYTISPWITRSCSGQDKDREA